MTAQNVRSEQGGSVQRLFAEHGLRCTRQRKALYAALVDSRCHPTTDELFRRVCDQNPGMSLATVYNTLEAFCQAGLAKKMPGAGANGSARFDAACDAHLHLRCRATGNIADVPDDLSQKVLEHIPNDTLKQIEKQYGFKVNQVQIELVGEYH